MPVNESSEPAEPAEAEPSTPGCKESATEEGAEESAATVTPDLLATLRRASAQFRGPDVARLSRLTDTSSAIQRIIQAQLVPPVNLTEYTRKINEAIRPHTTATLSTDMTQFAEWVDNFQELARPTAVSVLRAQMKLLDGMTPAALLAKELAQTTQLAQRLLGDSAVTSWRLSLRSDDFLQQLARTSLATTGHASTSPFEDLLRVSRAQVKMSAWAADRDSTGALIGPASGQPLALWTREVMSLPADPATRLLSTSSRTGAANLGLLSGDLLSPPPVDDVEDDAVDLIDTEVIAPWRAQRLVMADKLYAALADVDPRLCELLDGAWDDVERRGPGAAVKIANAAVEVLDRTLRGLASDEDVRTWHASSGRDRQEFEGQQRPPRSMRVRFLASRLGPAAEIVEAQVDGLILVFRPLHKRLQGIKHASAGDFTVARALLMTAENILSALLLDD